MRVAMDDESIILWNVIHLSSLLFVPCSFKKEKKEINVKHTIYNHANFSVTESGSHKVQCAVFDCDPCLTLMHRHRSVGVDTCFRTSNLLCCDKETPRRDQTLPFDPGLIMHTVPLPPLRCSLCQGFFWPDIQLLDVL